MIPTEILKKVRRIQIQTAALVNDLFAGQYHSAFKGRGMEFEDVREYQPGDDVRSIDWNVTARAGRPFVKNFREERELTVMLVVDISPSQEFGSDLQLKSEVVAELGATLAFSAIQNNDKVGMLLFTDRVEGFVKAEKGARHVLRVVRELLYHEPQGHGTDIGGALRYLARVMRRRAVIFLISDFHAPDFLQALSLLKRRHDVIPIRVRDPRESELPSAGYVELLDPETGEVMLINTRSRKTRAAYQRLVAQTDEGLTDEFRRRGVDVIDIVTGESFVGPLRRFFRKRGRRR